MPGEQFRTPYDADDELERCRRIREDESRRARAIVAARKAEDARRFHAPADDDSVRLRGMVHVPYSGWDGVSWVWIRPEYVSYVEAPSERGGWYGYRWKCAGRMMDFIYFVGREKCGEMEAVSEEERERRISEVNTQWSMFYDQVVCGGIR